MQKSKNYKVVNFCTLMICSCKVNYYYFFLTAVFQFLLRVNGCVDLRAVI